MEYYQGLRVEKLNVNQRVDLLERDVRDHSKSLTALMEAQALMIKRVTELEEAHQQRVIYEVREEQRDIALGLRLLAIEEQLKNIRTAGSKLLWVVVTAIVLAVVAFIVSGGLAKPVNVAVLPLEPRQEYPSSSGVFRSDLSVP